MLFLLLTFIGLRIFLGRFNPFYLQVIFDQLINTFIENKVGLSTQFLSEEVVAQLQNNVVQLALNHNLKVAGTSNSTIVINKEVRGDQIFWLDKMHNNPFETEFLNLIDDFVLHLNSSCYTGITDYEFHYALYGAGSFYSKHLDQFKNNDSRQYSMIFYLNHQWKTGDGGELCIHHEDDSLQCIAPMAGTSVFFKSSELLHEVLLTHKPRMSITGWLKV